MVQVGARHFQVVLNALREQKLEVLEALTLAVVMLESILLLQLVHRVIIGRPQWHNVEVAALDRLANQVSLLFVQVDRIITNQDWPNRTVDRAHRLVLRVLEVGELRHLVLLFIF